MKMEIKERAEACIKEINSLHDSDCSSVDSEIEKEELEIVMKYFHNQELTHESQIALMKIRIHEVEKVKKSYKSKLDKLQQKMNEMYIIIGPKSLFEKTG